MIVALILLGLFTVYVINSDAGKPATQETKINTLIPTQTTNIEQPKTSSPSSQTQSVNMNLQKTSTPSSQIENIQATIKTSRGDIELALYSKDAPNTVKNFLSKAQSGFYVDKIFHRVEDWVIQGGDPLGNGTGGGKMPTELNDKSFVAGSLGIARGQDINISNDAQFFITKKDSQFLDGKYTNFGIVTKGMEVVEKIEIGDKILGIVIE